MIRFKNGLKLLSYFRERSVNVNLMVSEWTILSISKTANQMKRDWVMDSSWRLKNIGRGIRCRERRYISIVRGELALFWSEMRQLSKRHRMIWFWIMKRRWVAVDNDDKYFKLYAKNKPYLNDKALFIPYSTSVKNYTESKGIPYSDYMGWWIIKFKIEYVLMRWWHKQNER